MPLVLRCYIMKKQNFVSLGVRGVLDFRDVKLETHPFFLHAKL